MEPREERGAAIAQAGKLRRKESLWIVPSQSGHGTYVVEPDSRTPNCSCPDFETRQLKCKHIWAVEYAVQYEATAEGASVTETLRVTYRQDWSAYNAAQTSEKKNVAALLHALCSAIDNPLSEGRGRPKMPLSDAVFAAVMKVYATTSARRVMSDMQAFAEQGYIDRTPHFNSISNALESTILTPILKAMIEESARPLREVETDFAADSTGFSSCIYERWFDAKYGRERSIAKYVKGHMMVGVTTNVVTSVEVTPAYISDYQMFSPLLRRTTARFNVANVSADKAYSGRSNVAAIAATGAKPLIPFKSNANSKGSELWKQTFEFFRDNRDEFLKQYHKRSNVETTFSMIKAKFGAFVRSKTPTAQVNEILCKVLAHNLCVLVQSFFELGIEPQFWQSGTAALTEARPVGWFRNLPERQPWSGPKKGQRAPVRHAVPELG